MCLAPISINNDNLQLDYCCYEMVVDYFTQPQAYNPTKAHLEIYEKWRSAQSTLIMDCEIIFHLLAKDEGFAIFFAFFIRYFSSPFPPFISFKNIANLERIFLMILEHKGKCSSRSSSQWGILWISAAAMNPFVYVL